MECSTSEVSRSEAGSSTRPFIIINATEIGSAIGRNRFKTKDETMYKIWERTDYQTFCIANALESEEEVIAIIDRHWKNAASDEEKNDFSQILFLDWDKQEDTVVKMLTEIFPKPGVSLKSSFIPLQREIYKLIKTNTDSDFRSEKLLREAEVEWSDIHQKVQKLTANEKKPVSECVKEISEEKNIKKEETKKALQSELSKKRGEALQETAIKHFEIKMKTKVKQPIMLFQKDVEYEGVKWKIQGRIDGDFVKEDKVIEVKNRTMRYYCDDHERIQLQTYMFLCEKKQGLFLERLNGRPKTTTFTFKEQEWKENVIPPLKEFVAKLIGKIESYRELVEDNMKYYINFATTTPPTAESSCKRPADSSANSDINEKSPRIEDEEQDCKTLEFLSQ